MHELVLVAKAFVKRRDHRTTSSICMEKRRAPIHMEAPEAKRRRINEVRARLPHMSQTALAQICKSNKRGELPDITCRAEIRKARDAQALQNTLYGPILESFTIYDKDETPHVVEVANPVALLYAAAQQKVCKLAQGHL